MARGLEAAQGAFSYLGVWVAYKAVLAEWKAVTLVLDTPVLWGRLCWVRASLVYRGRALPVAWRMLPPRSNPSPGLSPTNGADSSPSRRPSADSR